MSEDFDAELRIALAEGLLTEAEVDALREEARRLDRGLLTLLREQGRLSEGTFVSLMAQLRGGTAPRALAPSSKEPAFPVLGWERYQFVRFLGEGGMGRVFLAYDPRLRREVALKFVRGDDPELARRFVAEARAQARVNHECVCKVYEVGEVEGRSYIAMQFIAGQPLSTLARALTVEQKALLLREAAKGVHEAHRSGLIHRDLKPSNLMVERAEEGTFRLYVMDFGLARDWNEGATATGTVLGTPQYMSPEQARGEVSTLDRRADVYSLGATLYSVLTGQPPIPGANGLEVLNNLVTLEPRPPRQLNPDIPVDLEAIILKCLEKERSARYDSARAVAEELERFLAGEPVQARSTGGWYQLRKKLRKHRAMLSVAAVALSLTLLALGWAGLQRREAAVRERLARRFTEQVEQVEARARYSELSPLHDTRADMQTLRTRMGELAQEIRAAGSQAEGPGHYAMGRGALALGDELQAREHLEAAWRSGFREPRVAYALALVMGRQYQEQLLEAERIQGPERRESRKREAERHFRDPAISYLKQSVGAEVPSTGYVAALLAFYEGRLSDALAGVQAVGETLPWFYEAPKLRGDILLARATQRWRAGDVPGAREDFKAGREAYAAAAEIGRSVPAIHGALGELEYGALVMELYGKGEPLSYYNQGLVAVSRALTAAPDHYDSLVLRARFFRRLMEFRRNLGEDLGTLPEEAVASAQRALELVPSRPQARLELGRSYWGWVDVLQSRAQDPSEQLRKAVESFESIAPKDRDYDFHLHLGLVYRTWADHEEQVGADPMPKRAKSIESFLAATQRDERVPDGWINLGIAYYTRAAHPRALDADGDVRQALATLEKARALNPGHVVPLFYGGLTHELEARRLRNRGGDAGPALARAVQLYSKGIELNASIPQLHNGLCLALIQQARASWDSGADPMPMLDKARAACEQSVAVAPKDGYGYVNLSEVFAQRALYQRARGEPPGASVEAADAALRQALQRLPENAGAWANLGMAHAILATFELDHGRAPGPSAARAEEALRQAIARKPTHAEAWYYLGEALGAQALSQQNRAQEQEAAKAFQKALELAPERQDFRIGFGHFLRRQAGSRKQGSPEPGPLLEQGLELAGQLLTLRPGWPDARLLRGSLLSLRAELHLGDSEQQRGWRRQALEDLSSALSANPGLRREWESALQRLRASE